MILLGRPENKETFQATLNYKPVGRDQCELRMLIKALLSPWTVGGIRTDEGGKGASLKLRTRNTGHRRAHGGLEQAGTWLSTLQEIGSDSLQHGQWDRSRAGEEEVEAPRPCPELQDLGFGWGELYVAI